MADIYSRIIYQAEHHQVRLTVNEFRDVEYLHLRKYFLDFSGEYMPSKEGISMPLDLDNSRELFAGLLEILSLAESKELIYEHFAELLKATYPDEEIPRLCESEVSRGEPNCS